MSIINDSITLGTSTRNLVLKTRGTVHIKVGDKFYELNFREQNQEQTQEIQQENTENQEITSTQSPIIFIDNKSLVDYMEYPGDGKLIIGTDDKSLLASFEGTYIELFSNSADSSTITNTTVVTNSVDSNSEEQNITSLSNVEVMGTLRGLYGSEIDFGNNTITFDNVVVGSKFTFPKNTVLCSCKKSVSGVTNYAKFDFVVLGNEFEEITVKNGAMVRSLVKKDMTVNAGSATGPVEFKKNTTYVIFDGDGTLEYTEI